MKKYILLSICLIFLFLINLSSVWAVSEREILIVSDNTGDPSNDAITSVDYYQEIIGNISNGNNLTYNMTIWDQALSGTPSLSYLQSYSLVIWTSGAFWGNVLSSGEIAILEDYVEQGGNLIISGASLMYDWGQNSFTDNVLHANNPTAYYSAYLYDINITNITHSITSGFNQNELLTFIASPGGYNYYTDIIFNVDESAIPDNYTVSLSDVVVSNIETTSIPTEAISGILTIVEPYNITFLPPISLFENFTLQDGTTLPLKFSVNDGNYFVVDDTVKVRIFNESLGINKIYNASGEGDDYIRINETEEHYIVNIHTNQLEMPLGEYAIEVSFNNFQKEEIGFELIQSNKGKGKKI